MTAEALLSTFRPLIDAARGLDLSDPAAAEAELSRRFDPASQAAATLNAELLRLFDEGLLAQRGAPPVRFGRVAKPGEPTADHSIDVVVMDGAGPRHRHPNGEIDYCVRREGTPRFDGREPGWVVYGPDSVHVPTVAGGEMLIVYLLPAGAMEFLEG